MSVLLVLAAVGLCVGSFLNVAIWRLPRRRSVVRPRSQCPACATTLRTRDLVPVFSWILLRGRCHACRARIAVRYPMVELATAALFVAAGVRFGVSYALPAYLVFVASSIMLSFIDLDTLTLPRRLVYATGLAGAALLTVAAVASGDPHRLVDALIGAAGASAFLLVLHLVVPAGMGFGDVRYAAVVGLYVGWLGVLDVPGALFVAFALGAVVGLAWMLFGSAGRKTALPFGPFLAAGGLLTVLLGNPVLRVWPVA